MTQDLLYITLKNDIMLKIFQGIYKDGDTIPSERDLADEHNMSRVTVRKALDLLEKDGIIKRKLGKGTIVSLSKQGYSGRLDIIALVAPAQRTFFATFLDYFQKIADHHNSLVVFTQQSEHEPIKSTLFKLLQKGIHNVVIWLDYETLSGEDLRRLRGLGMNIVLFDITIRSPYADCVCLDNRDAISTLFQYVTGTKNKNIVYVTRENSDPSSFYERYETFKALSPLGFVWNFPWDFKKDAANHPDKFVFEHLYPKYKPNGIICSDGNVGVVLKKELIQHNIKDILLVCVDESEECDELDITVYKQPYDRFAEKIFYCLMDQNFNHLSWKASIYRVKGELIVRDL